MRTEVEREGEAKDGSTKKGRCVFAIVSCICMAVYAKVAGKATIGKHTRTQTRRKGHEKRERDKKGCEKRGQIRNDMRRESM